MPDATRKIVIHDYGGHHFPGELGQALARRGHEVLHLYFTQCMNPSAARNSESLPGYCMRGLQISSEFKKFSFFTRRQQEIEYGKIATEVIRDFAPDIVISSTTPTDAQAIIQRYCRDTDTPFVFWLQDIISVAITKILPKKLPVLGHFVAAYYRWREAKLLRESTAVISITHHFVPICGEMGVARERNFVIENWAPLDEIIPIPRPSAWAVEQGLADKRVILYSGTLGLKHNPSIFEHLCRRFADQPDVRIVVISEGIGADWLKERKVKAGLDNLLLFPFQPYSRLSEVLASGDLVLAILEEEAGIFSVPSKILSYLCAGRPILLSVPLENLAADTVRRADAGLALSPKDVQGLLAAADSILKDEQLRTRYAANGRAYAERTFDIENICSRFEKIFNNAIETTSQ